MASPWLGSPAIAAARNCARVSGGGLDNADVSVSGMRSFKVSPNLIFLVDPPAPRHLAGPGRIEQRAPPAPLDEADLYTSSFGAQRDKLGRYGRSQRGGARLTGAKLGKASGLYARGATRRIVIGWAHRRGSMKPNKGLHEIPADLVLEAIAEPVNANQFGSQRQFRPLRCRGHRCGKGGCTD